jgi:hypothetical protein
MSSITTRAAKGSALTHAEVDANFTNLNSGKAEVSGQTFTGAVVLPAGSATAGGVQVGTGATYKPSIYSPGADQLAISTGGSERARLDSSGRLLVGTSTARSNFYNFTTTAPRIQNEAINTNDASYAGIFGGTSGSSAFVFARHRGGIGDYTLVQSGDVLGRLSYQGGDGAEFVEAACITAEVDGTPGANDMPGRLVFSTTADGAASPTERMRITSAGTLSFNDGANNLGGTSRLIHLGINGASGWGITTRMQSSTGIEVLRIYNNSDTLVGNITASTTATAYNTSSDYRLKKNITSVTDGITRLQQLKPSRFNFIADLDKTVDGFIAHEVQAVVPEAITGKKDAVDEEGNPQYQGIDQSKLVPLLTAALQEAIAKIETLEARLTAAGI